MQQTSVEIVPDHIIRPSQLPVTRRKHIWFQHGEYNVLNYSLRGCQVCLLPTSGLAVHRETWAHPINNARPVLWLALYRAEHDQAFHEQLFPAIQEHLRSYRPFDLYTLPIPEEPHYATLMSEAGIVRPLVGAWDEKHPLVGRHVEDLLDGEKPSYTVMSYNEECFPVAPDYALLQRSGW